MRWATLLLLGSATLTLADEPPPRPLTAWANGPLEARVAFDRDVPPSFADALVGTKILSGDPARADERGTLRIAAARAEGKTLILATDPHSRDTTYRLELPAPVGRALAYRLRGVEFTLDTGEGTKPLDAGVWPELDSSVFPREVERVGLEAETAGKPTRLVLKTLVALPKGKVTLKARASVPFTIEFGGESAKSNRMGTENVAGVASEVEADVADLTWTLTARRPIGFSLAYTATDDPQDRRPAADQLVLTWAPPPSPPPTESPVPEAVLKGGDTAKGAVIFRSEQAKCATCHKVRGEGGDVGPDLNDLSKHDRAWIYRQISEPSAVIHPDYVPYTVLTKDGRVLAGIVRADGAGAIKVTNTEGKPEVVAKSAIEELKSSATSIMPVGLLGAVGEEGVRDLLAFLTERR